MEAKLNTLNKLKTFEALFQKGFKSRVIDQTLTKLAVVELTGARRELDEIESRINDLEKKYNMRSDDFAGKFHAGVLDDSADFIEWVSFIDMQTAILDKIQALDNINEQ